MVIKMFLHTIVIVIFCVGIDSLDIYVSKRNGEDNTLCGTYQNPCNTFDFAVKKSHHTATTTLRLDGGSDKTYIYHVNRTIIPKRSLAMTNYKNNKFRPVIKSINQNTIKNYLFHAHEKMNIELKVENIIFKETALLLYTSSLIISITNCSFENSATPIIKSNNAVESVVMNVSHSTIKNSGLISMFKAENLLAVIESCTFRAEACQDQMIKVKATKEVIVKVINSTFKCFTAIILRCSINSLIFNETYQPIQPVSSIEICKSSFFSKYDAYEMSYGVFSNGCKEITVKESVFSGFRYSAIRVYSASKMIIYNSSFTNNKCTRGGAIYVEDSRHLLVYYSLFSYNTANTGGAICVSKGKGVVLIQSSIFLHNSANMSGGSIHARTAGFYRKMILLLQTVRIIGKTTSPLTTGIIIHTNAQVLYKNVSVTISNTVLDVPMLDGIRCEDRAGTKIDQLNGLFLTCPYNFDLAPLQRSYRVLSFQCRRCPKGMYNLKGGNVLLSTRKTKLVATKSDFKCFQCPPGAKCKYGIQSKGNFWGYVGNHNKIIFLPCPASYCCSQKTTKCVSYNTCDKNRTGILCGTCQMGYRLSYFNNDCVKNKRCNQWLFWILYLAYGILYVVFLMYFKTVFKCLYNKLRKLKCKKREFEVNNDLYGYIRFEESMDEDVEEVNVNEKEENDSENNSKAKYDGSKTDLYISGLKSIIFFFFQIQVLLEIPAAEKNNRGYITAIKNSISSIFNFELIQLNLSKLCPSTHLDALSKAVIKLGNIFILFVILFALALIVKVTKFFKRKRDPTYNSTGTTDKILKNIRTCSIQVTLLGYTAVNTFCFRMLNCVSINNDNYLYIQGDLKCYTWWQYCIMIYTVLWIIPFTVSVHVSVKMLRRSQINLSQFYLAFAIPPISAYYYLRSLCTSKALDVNVHDTRDDIDKVTYIFTGPYKYTKNGQSNWEAVLICRRMVITALCAFIVNPISRMIFTLLLMQGFFMHHLYTLPYRTEILNHLETASLGCLIFINIENLFFAFLYMNDQSSVPGINIIAIFFVWSEHIILAAPVIIIILISVYILCKKLDCMFRNCFV